MCIRDRDYTRSAEEPREMHVKTKLNEMSPQSYSDKDGIRPPERRLAWILSLMSCHEGVLTASGVRSEVL